MTETKIQSPEFDDGEFCVSSSGRTLRYVRKVDCLSKDMKPITNTISFPCSMHPDQIVDLTGGNRGRPVARHDCNGWMAMTFCSGNDMAVISISRLRLPSGIQDCTAPTWYYPVHIYGARKVFCVSLRIYETEFHLERSARVYRYSRSGGTTTVSAFDARNLSLPLPRDEGDPLTDFILENAFVEGDVSIGHDTVYTGHVEQSHGCIMQVRNRHGDQLLIRRGNAASPDSVRYSLGLGPEYAVSYLNLRLDKNKSGVAISEWFNPEMASAIGQHITGITGDRDTASIIMDYVGHPTMPHRHRADLSGLHEDLSEYVRAVGDPGTRISPGMPAFSWAMEIRDIAARVNEPFGVWEHAIVQPDADDARFTFLQDGQTNLGPPLSLSRRDVLVIKAHTTGFVQGSIRLRHLANLVALRLVDPWARVSRCEK